MTPMRILLVVDFSPGTPSRLAEFAAREWPVHAIVRVLAVVEKIPPSAAELWFDAQGSLEEVLIERRKRAEELTLESAAFLRGKGLTVETAVRTGRRRKEIGLEAKSWRADLVVQN